MKFSSLLPDLPFSQPSLQDQFQQQHERFIAAFPGWSIQSTRRKIIANYWFDVILHNYFKLLVPGSILVLLFSKLPIAILVSGLASGGFVSVPYFGTVSD